MNLSKFFIDRPIFAGVLSLLMFLAGLIALRSLPISEYPEVVPPSVVVRAQYPGANPKVIAETVAAPLRQTAVFPPMVVQMISVGEATGALDTMLSKIADFYEEEVDVAVAGLLTLLEPLMIALLGGIVGGIVIAMYLPIFSLINQLTGGGG